MINLIKMNLYRMLRSKFVYILFLVTFGIALLITSLETDPVQQEMDKEIMEEEGIDLNEEGLEIGIVLGQSGNESKAVEDLYCSFIGSGFLLLITGLFVAVYSDDERKSGFLKNLTVGRKGKKYIFASKIAIVLLFCTILMLVSFAAVYLGSNLMSTYGIGNMGKLLAYTMREILLHAAYGLLIMTVYEMCRNNVISILVAVFGSLNLFGFIFSLLETKIPPLTKLTQILDGRLELVQYFLVTRARQLPVDYPAFLFVPTTVVAIAGLILYGILGMIIYSKRDTL